MCLCLFKSQLSINPYHLLNISYLVTAWSTHNITYHSIGVFRLLVFWCDLPIPAKANAMVPTPKSSKLLAPMNSRVLSILQVYSSTFCFPLFTINPPPGEQITPTTFHKGFVRLLG